MADFSSLTAALQRVGLETVQHDHHELRLEFPILDLLDDEDDSMVYLPYPENAEYRERPASSLAHLADAGAEFFVRLPLRQDGSSEDTGLDLPELLVKIRQLGSARGHGVLQFAACEYMRAVVSYRFRLMTESEGLRTQTYECELSQPAMAQLEAICKDEEWMQLVLGLINRSSDRAYYHVHKRLRHYRWYQFQTEQHELHMKWDQEEFQEANRLLAANLSFVRMGLEGAERERQIRDLDVEEDIEDLFLIPCGHLQFVNLANLKHMSASLCKHYRCDCCIALILQPDDFRSLHFSEDRQRRAEMAKREKQWEQLAAIPVDDCARFKLHGGNVAFAAQHALKSLQVPETVSPKSLQFAKSNEADAIMKAIWLEIGRREVFEGSLEEIGTTLLKLRDEILRHRLGASASVSVAQMLPPDWERMSERWLMRAVQLISVPGYDGRSIAEVFEGETQESVSQRRATVEELEGLLAQASLVLRVAY